MFVAFSLLGNAMKTLEPGFHESFYEMCKMEDEYIVRVNLDLMYDLKWNQQ